VAGKVLLMLFLFWLRELDLNLRPSGYEPDAQAASQQNNRRNGTARKTLKGNEGTVPINLPRDRPSCLVKGLASVR
jgi:transposase-like protein